MKVLVTGATGFIGLEVARQLATAGLSPRLMVRRPMRGALLTGLDAEVVQADLTSPPSLRRAVQGVDAVIHLAARATFESYARVRPTIVDGTRALAEAARAEGVASFVFGSSLFVYGSQKTPIDAATEPAPLLGYGRAKLEAEMLLARQLADSSTSFAALRLPHVYGARSLMFERVRTGRIVFPGRMHNTCGHLHVDDAAAALIAAASQRISGVMPIADRDAMSWRDFMNVVQTFYPRLRVTALPASLATAGAWAATALTAWRDAPLLATPGTVRGFNLNLPVDSSAAWRQLGIEPRYPSPAQGIPATLDSSVPFRWQHPVADRAA